MNVLSMFGIRAAGFVDGSFVIDNSSGASQILATNYPATNLGINGSLLMKGYVDNVLSLLRISYANYRHVSPQNQNKPY
jgi:hypothetical protein